MCNDRLVRVQTILGLNTFINVLDGELNKLNKEQVNDILIEDTNVIIPESEDNINENYSEELKTLRNVKLSEMDHGLIREDSK